MADESPGKPLREDVQAKQQALDEAKAALAKYEADKAAAATADADEDAPMANAPEASDEEDDELVRAAEERIVAPRRDGDTTAPDSRSATPAPEAFAEPGAGWARAPRRPSAKQQFDQLRALNLEDDETGEIVELYWADRLGLQVDGRSMDEPFATWSTSDARFLEKERRRKKMEAVSALLLRRDVCKCGARVVDGGDELLEGAWRCDALQCQLARCASCLVKEPMDVGQTCGGCSSLVWGPEDVEPALKRDVPGFLRTYEVPPDLLDALDACAQDNSEANLERLQESWNEDMGWFRPPVVDGRKVSFRGDMGRTHARIQARRLRSWRDVLGGRRGPLARQGGTAWREGDVVNDYFGRAALKEFVAQDDDCRKLCVPTRPNPGEGHCECCKKTADVLAEGIAEAKRALKGKKKRGREPTDADIIKQLLRLAPDSELEVVDGVDGKKYKRGEGKLDKDHVKYWAIFRVLVGV